MRDRHLKFHEDRDNLPVNSFVGTGSIVPIWTLPSLHSRAYSAKTAG